ncbi:MAG: Gfo/Idh/MocA family oxidoreductase [Candidatus Hydrogenedentes bacterium]|nr:Gfo/Idh/MocA family oxidoreductase [Candidatus Hydrogenedentota bacterium]
MSVKRVRVGIIGCGNISDIYFTNLRKFDVLEVAACADLVRERAQEKAEKHAVPRALPVEKLLADKSIELVVNLTIPNAHAQVALAALKAGKSVYNEKPLAVTREDAQKLIRVAKSKKLLLGGAPDTFLGAGIQTCIKLIRDGWIGEPVAATGFMLCHGHESWHPDPEFYYKPGGGPMFDMGPYYLTALVALMGPVRRICGSARVTFPQRLITSEPKRGTVIDVDVPTHVAGVMDFHTGAIATIVTSFDVWGSAHPYVEIYGTSGSMQAPDPNSFGGPVKIRRAGASEWSEIPLTHPHAENSRGIGVADMALALREQRRHRANESLTYHVLDLMHAFHDSSTQGRHIDIQTTCDSPTPMPM